MLCFSGEDKIAGLNLFLSSFFIRDKGVDYGHGMSIETMAWLVEDLWIEQFTEIYPGEGWFATKFSD